MFLENYKTYVNIHLKEMISKEIGLVGSNKNKQVEFLFKQAKTYNKMIKYFTRILDIIDENTKSSHK